MRDPSGLHQGGSRSEQCAGDILKAEPSVDWSWGIMERKGLGPHESRIESEHEAGTLLSSFPQVLWSLQSLCPHSKFCRREVVWGPASNPAPPAAARALPR